MISCSPTSLPALIRFYIAQGPTTLYIEPGKWVNVVEPLASSGSAAFEVLVTGYMIAP
jgi:hypothetical protein